MKYDVLGVGNALLDIQARVPDSVLAELHFAKGIMTLVDEPTQEQILGKLHQSALHRCAGGSAANTIMGVADFGGTAAYVGKVGQDEIGEFFLGDMRKMGVAIESTPIAGRTGTCVVLITEDAGLEAILDAARTLHARSLQRGLDAKH